MTIRPSAAAAVLVTLAAGLLLVGCGPTTPDPAPSTPKPKPTVSSTPTPTPTPTPAPTVAAPAATGPSCESLLTDSLAEFTSNGLSVSGPGAYADKLRAENDPIVGFYDAGGVFCIVSAGLDAYALYGWAPFTDASWAPIRASLISDGWTEQVTDAGFVLDSPEPAALSTCYYRPGQFGGCASTFDLLDEVLANAP